MESSEQNETISKPSQMPVQKTGKRSEEIRLLRQAVELLQRQHRTSLTKSLSSGAIGLYRMLATHVLILLLGISLTGWWMLRDDSWKSYIDTGCNPSPETYTQRFEPAIPPIANNPSLKDLIAHKQQRIEQLLLINNNLNLDRDAVRSACKR